MRYYYIIRNEVPSEITTSLSDLSDEYVYFYDGPLVNLTRDKVDNHTPVTGDRINSNRMFIGGVEIDEFTESPEQCKQLYLHGGAIACERYENCKLVSTKWITIEPFKKSITSIINKYL